jgi:hypothetical protein
MPTTSNPGRSVRVDGAPGRASVRARPAWLQALGRDEPPLTIVVDGEVLERVELFKHDSWAATALYRSASSGPQAVCKFHRQQPLLRVVPMRWFGRFMAGHELRLLTRLADLPGVPVPLGPVRGRDGAVIPYAVARRFVAGHPLKRSEPVSDTFFPEITRLLAAMHVRGVAYVDLHKRENVIVADGTGRPYLVDFQISVRMPTRGPLGWFLRILQRSDNYHLLKHWVACRPDQCAETSASIARGRPWYIRAHRLVAMPFRETRRRLLVASGVRSGRGRVETELVPEDAVRREHAPPAATTSG